MKGASDLQFHDGSRGPSATGLGPQRREGVARGIYTQTIRRPLAFAAVAALALCATPAAHAASYHSCGNGRVTPQGGYGLVYSDFHVQETSCRRAFDVMRGWFAEDEGPRGRIQGWRIRERPEGFRTWFSAWKGSARFYCKSNG
jgi:hypothetical protein